VNSNTVRALLLIVLLPGSALAQSAPPFKETEPHVPCNNYNPDRQVFFGELHLHTIYSADAVTLETRNTPSDAYSFAKGNPVGLPPFVDTRLGLVTGPPLPDVARGADASTLLPGVSDHPYCLPPARCQYTATNQLQFPPGRALDFAAITDHAEFFGEDNICWYEPTQSCSQSSECPADQFCFAGNCVPVGYDSQACILGREEVNKLRGGLGQALFGSYVTSENPRRFPFCQQNSPNGTCANQAKNIWQQIQLDANNAYDQTAQCSFTSFIAYEYTGMPAMGQCVADSTACFQDAPDCDHAGKICCTSTSQPGCENKFVGGGNNLHRNVIFRNDDVIDKPITYIEAPTGCGNGGECDHQAPIASPQTLLTKLEDDCLHNPRHPRCDVLTIPHNGNLSGGAMFLMPQSFEEALLRAQMEPLVELFQIKGTSECQFLAANPGVWGTTDELCNFETMNFARIGGPFIPTPDAVSIPPNSFVRNVLKQGLVFQNQTGLNPFKYGFAGATDNHNGTPSATDAPLYAKVGAHGDQSFIVSGEALNQSLMLGLESNGGGVTGVWAEENTRDSIFAALQRRETFATSSTRPAVRMFGGFSLPSDMCSLPDFAHQGYQNGVPMGGTLNGAQATGAPTFAVMATQDPGWAGHPGTPLQSVQIIKGWVDENGQTQEQVYSVAGTPSNGASVDLSTCQPTGTGFAELCGEWTDPSFDPKQPAFYYARVLENPSCRWNQYYCNARGVNCSQPFDPTANYTVFEYQQCCGAVSNALAPKTVQQRAWTSPIWFTPLTRPFPVGDR